ncbi:MAG: gamma-glutamylcyclotransferase [Wenzhouxiangellaceae bacterium]|jgi:cation transport regulator ChaC|nr:gamma-glutamylcyclotransferase [Wenzhouxiangellaceae bacterium]MBS3746283.1 gamma-glutamylcyclotransferase [Wenzhouxiangellaceae bacterium]MBS3823732.1 gamma-glutamylcyclotransferase [Wenzhouxiangellaceae bacterium]
MVEDSGHATVTDSRTADARQPEWVFGYGSLIYKVDFPYIERRVASIAGWTRRFWQGSHDHRGTPEAPGRVVTLLPAPGTICRGMAYRIEPGVFTHLDHREKNGYARHRVDIALADSGKTVSGTLYVASEHNPAYLGPAGLDEVAAHIAGARGPSGANRDYLFDLADALRRIGDADDHVAELERRVRALAADASAP